MKWLKNRITDYKHKKQLEQVVDFLVDAKTIRELQRLADDSTSTLDNKVADGLVIIQQYRYGNFAPLKQFIEKLNA